MPPRKNHPAEVAACLAAVRRAFEVVAVRGVVLDACTIDAVDLVARWHGGAVVDDATWSRTSSELERVGAAAFAEDRTRGWACAAAGNLVWMARKERGWADATRTTIDAAVCTITADDRTSVGADVHAELVAVHGRALAQALEAPTTAKARRSPFTKAPDLTASIGALAEAMLRRLSPKLDRRRRATTRVLEAALTERGLPTWPVLAAFDRVFGGVVMSDEPGNEGSDWTIGVYASIQVGLAVGEDEGERRVMIAMSPNDVEYSMDAAGRVWAQDGIEDPEPVIFAKDGATAIAKILLFTRVWLARREGAVEDREDADGDAIARDLGVALVEPASDEIGRMWGDAAVLVVETGEGISVARG